MSTWIWSWFSGWQCRPGPEVKETLRYWGSCLSISVTLDIQNISIQSRLLALVAFEITSGSPAPKVSGRKAIVRIPLDTANPPRMNIGTWWQADDEETLFLCELRESPYVFPGQLIIGFA